MDFANFVKIIFRILFSSKNDIYYPKIIDTDLVSELFQQNIKAPC